MTPRPRGERSPWSPPLADTDLVCHTTSPRLARLVRDSASPHRVAIDSLYAPRKADVVVTTGGLTTKVERYAWSLMAVPIVLPEGSAYLGEQLASGVWKVVCGAEMEQIGPGPRDQAPPRRWA